MSGLPPRDIDNLILFEERRLAEIRKRRRAVEVKIIIVAIAMLAIWIASLAT